MKGLFRFFFGLMMIATIVVGFSFVSSKDNSFDAQMNEFENASKQLRKHSKNLNIVEFENLLRTNVEVSNLNEKVHKLGKAITQHKDWESKIKTFYSKKLNPECVGCHGACMNAKLMCYDRCFSTGCAVCEMNYNYCLNQCCTTSCACD